MQFYLRLSLVPIALTTKQLALPRSKFVFKPVTTAFHVMIYEVVALPSVTSCSSYYKWAETNTTLFGFNYSGKYCILSMESNMVKNDGQGQTWQTSSLD